MEEVSVSTSLTQHCVSCINTGDYRSAVFFAQKAMSVLEEKKNTTTAVLLLAKCYKLTEQYERAHTLLEREGLLQTGTEVRDELRRMRMVLRMEQ
jgi:thioredoxin-like negative regulator of GroEL